ncbi:MAG: hypothetical protein GY857_05190 [Desulfobacula sp.]|nr:hypothetical protein [Desulfobacula sp.]
MAQRYSQYYVAILPLLILILLNGCAGTKGNYGRMIHSHDVTMAFEDFKVNPAYQYYYFGTKTYPQAVVGISKDFTVDPGLWKAIELTPKKLHFWIWVHADRNIKGFLNYGANIIGPNGEHIGIWYSLRSRHQRARFILTSENSVKIGAAFDNKETRPFRVLRVLRR